MDYFGIVKRAWKITWRYKILWLFGLFVGAGSGSSPGNSSNYTNRSSGEGPTQAFTEAYRWLLENTAFLFLIVGVLLLIGIIWWAIGVAASAGLVHLANEAEEGRPVRAREGWRIGFDNWGGVFVVGFLLALPSIVILLLFGGLALALFFPVVSGSGGDPGRAAILAPLCCVAPIAIIALVVIGVVVGILYELALRHVVLGRVRALDAIRRAWIDLRTGYRQVLPMWGVLLLVGIVYSIAIAVIAIGLLLPVVLLGMAEQWALAITLGILAIIVLMVPGAIYATLHSVSWTLFFRHFTGMAPLPAPAMNVPMPPTSPLPPAPGAPSPFPPAPPAPPAPSAPEPPAPPAPPAPSAPEPPAPPAPEPPAQPPAPPGPPAQP